MAGIQAMEMLLILFSGTSTEKPEKASESKTEEMIEWEDKLQKLLSAVEGAGRVKVLARGTMTKRLTIIANKFSLQAVKMIVLAGGHADKQR